MRAVSLISLMVCAVLGWPLPAASGGLAAGRVAAAGTQKSKAEQYKESFLLYGNVYTEQGLTLPGANVKVRREDQKKPKWDSSSDDRGEFAIRVPPGPKYEITIKAKGFEPLVRMVDTWQKGDRLDLSFKMQRAGGGKKK